jgi:DNA (cytosine-5)-methyltransferase 1
VRHLDLFSGIGGFALACRMVGGIETVGFCERDNYCQRVLAKHWPDVPICNDIHKLKGNEYGPIDLITGGYPCQPFSVAGEQRGQEDDRHLWPEMRRIIAAARPDWVLAENVAGHIGMGLDAVLIDLDSIGYSAAATVIPACAVGAIHRRDRVWIVANNRGIGISGNIETEVSRSKGISWRENGGVASPIRELPAIPASGLCRASDGIPARVDRLRGLGNAIVPQVAAEIIRCIKEIERLTQ